LAPACGGLASPMSESSQWLPGLRRAVPSAPLDELSSVVVTILP
jgi:hypothetical protein